MTRRDLDLKQRRDTAAATPRRTGKADVGIDDGQPHPSANARSSEKQLGGRPSAGDLGVSRVHAGNGYAINEHDASLVASEMVEEEKYCALGIKQHLRY